MAALVQTSLDYYEYEYGVTNITLADLDVNQVNDMFEEMRYSIATNASLSASQLKSLGLDLQTEMLISCVYAGKVCDARNFRYYYTYEYGNCYMFNTGQALTRLCLTPASTLHPAVSDPNQVQMSTQPGSSNGLQLQLNVGYPSPNNGFCVAARHLLARAQSDEQASDGERRRRCSCRGRHLR